MEYPISEIQGNHFYIPENYVSKSGLFSKFDENAFTQNKLFISNNEKVELFFPGSISISATGFREAPLKKKMFILVEGTWKDTLESVEFKNKYINQLVTY